MSKMAKNRTIRVFPDGNLWVAQKDGTARASARIRACELLLAFAERTTDEAKLDRILPYVMTLLNDKSDLVKVTALRTLTQLVRIPFRRTSLYFLYF